MNNLIRNIEFPKIFNLKNLIPYKEGHCISEIKNEVNLNNKKNNDHCNNYATHCCLSCDKCWGQKYKP